MDLWVRFRRSGSGWAALLLAGLMLLGAPGAEAAGLAELTAGIEAALDQRQGVEAEILADAALAAAEAEGADPLDIANLHRLYGDALFYQERFAEAEPHYRDALALREAQAGADAADIAVSVNDLAIVLRRQDRFAEAEPLYRRLVELREGLLGPDHPDVARGLFWLARVIDSDGRTGEAAATMARAIARAVVAFGPDDPTSVEWMGERAAMLHDAGELAAAEAAYVEANALGARVFAAGDTRLAYTRQGLGNLYLSTGRAGEAVPLFRLALAAREAALGPTDAATVNSVDRLARALWAIDDLVAAETMFRRLLAAREATEGGESPAAADALRWIGRAASALDRRAEAEIVFKRALAISEASLGPTHVLTGFDLIALGQLYSGQQRFAEARPLLERAVVVFEQSEGDRRSDAAGRMALSFLEFAAGDRERAVALAVLAQRDAETLDGPRSRAVADVLATLAGYREQMGELAEAERLAVAARDLYAETAPQSRAQLRAGSTLGRIWQGQGRLDEALALQREVLAALTARFGADSANVQPGLNDVGATLFALGDYAGAAAAFERSTAIVERLATIDSEAAFQSRTGDVEDQAVARAGVFDALVKTYDRLAPADPAGYAEKSFRLAQRVIESRAAGALAQMAARQAAASGALAALVRERQDLVALWRRQDAALTLALAEGGDGSALRAALAVADARIVAIDAALAADFPAFAQLQRPAPLALEEVQRRLGENDVLLFFADTSRLGTSGAETYLWVVPKSGALRWVKLPRAAGELAAAVRELRRQMGVSGNSRGPQALTPLSGDSRPARVLEAAAQLHGAVLGQMGDVIAGRNLVIVPSPSLSALPFHMLVPEVPVGAADPYGAARWLARDHAITILPSVAALPVPEQPAGGSGRQPYLAFANPLLLGRGGDDRRAFERAGCGPREVKVAAVEEGPVLASLFRGATGDVAAIRALAPLPETADEVCAIAAALGAGDAALHLGAAATETAVKALSASGGLGAAAVVHFATHGLVSGELSGLAEPAIVLTPPATGDAEDDGLLTASEVATLRLDADWVILSACNTASSDGDGEALSGLARAFFYAGARALMVSHWPVNSDAAVALATGAVAELAAEPGIGRAEALRRAMLAEIARGGAHADPANWAPFIVVGAAP